MTSTATDVLALYRARKDRVDFVDVPELGYLVVRGQGDPAGPGFGAAIQTLFTVSYAAHFLLRKRVETPPRVMPLEALWWMDDPDQRDIVLAVALGAATMADSDRDRWQWLAMIAQLPPIDESVVAEAVNRARPKTPPALDQLRFERWTEGRCAQTLHLGPYADEGPSLIRLHEAITRAGCRPHGRHHEIYLGDPRRSAPDRLRTLLRHPVEPA
jgi:hypothetical protein